MRVGLGAKYEGFEALRSVFAQDEVVVLSVDEEGRPIGGLPDVDLVIVNGLSYARVASQYRALGVPVVGADTRTECFEKDKVFGKYLCQAVGVGVPSWDVVETVDVDRFMWRFPCYVKHRKAIGGTLSFRVESLLQVKNLVREYGYEDGLLVEQPAEGIEVSVNALVNSDGWRVFGMNYDMKRPNGLVVGNAYTSNVPAPLISELVPVFGMARRMGFRGVLAVSVFVSKRGVSVIEMNVRVGTASGYMYLMNVANMVDLLRGCAEDYIIPPPLFEYECGFAYVVDSGLRSSKFDLEVGMLKPIEEPDVVLVANRVLHGRWSDGSAPFVVVGFGSDMSEIARRVYKTVEKVDVPLRIERTLDVGRFDYLSKEAPWLGES